MVLNAYLCFLLCYRWKMRVRGWRREKRCVAALPLCRHAAAPSASAWLRGAGCSVVLPAVRPLGVSGLATSSPAPLTGRLAQGYFHQTSASVNVPGIM